MLLADPSVECEAGETAYNEGGGVDDVGYKVEDLSVKNDRNGEDVLDVLKVPARAKMNEFDAETDEGDKEHLLTMSALSQSSADIGRSDSVRRRLTNEAAARASSNPNRRASTPRPNRRADTTVTVSAVTKMIPAIAGASLVSRRYSRETPFGTRPSAMAVSMSDIFVCRRRSG